MLRPCIDLHDGKVKQIVGSTLRDSGPGPQTNFVSPRPPEYYVDLYRRDGLKGGHVIMLGPGNESAARAALGAWPGGMQIGGGIRPDNAGDWLAAGASHVIVTSYVFHDGHIDWERLARLTEKVGVSRLVLDLSCSRQENQYVVVTDRWQHRTDFALNFRNLQWLGLFAAEFLVHAADVEGKQQGIDHELVQLLAECSPVPVTYAGGARGLHDLRLVHELGQGRVDLTIGSGLDLFGGPIPYEEAVALSRKLESKSQD